MEPVPENRRLEMVGRIHRRFMSSQIAFAGVWILVAITVVAIWASMTSDVRHASEVVSEQPHHAVRISRVVETEDDVVAHVVLEGRDRHIKEDWALFSLADLDNVASYETGDRVTVAVDPKNPAIVYDVDHARPFSWWDSILGLAFIWGVASLIRRYYTRRWNFPDRSRWQLMRRHPITMARVLEVRAPREQPFARVRKVLTVLLDAFLRAEPDDSIWLVLIVEIDGRPYAWDVRLDRNPEILVGTEVPVWGRAKHNGWVVGLTQPDVLYPRSTLD